MAAGRASRPARRWLLALAVAVLAACAPGVPPEEAALAPPAEPPAGFPAADYRRAAAAGHRVLQVDPAQSRIVVEVRRDGPLARLGHDHVVASHDLRGQVDLDAGRADLYLALARLVVDDPAQRAAAGFAEPPDERAIAGTRRNMLTRVLDAGRFPFATIAVRRDAPDAPTVRAAITVHGATREFDVPVSSETLADGIAVAGRIDFRQSDFGIVPLTALNGALRVADRLDLHFRIVARRRDA
ncbi:YceI family protein [Azospira restricta]|uniref:YceI family protein n=1 Tax=Azospira restricta TaxID=404405 RepID=A0A974SMH1_9RHOO|nr:YceI family protein [Azospira restricta]QRJ63056.1 YceI family protein [Azospira restricta]